MGHETSHTSPGFGKNTNGFGIAIVAIVLVVFGLVAWNFWNSAAAEDHWYRFENTAKSAHGEGGHESHGTEAKAEEAPAAEPVADSAAGQAAADTTAHSAAH